MRAPFLIFIFSFLAAQAYAFDEGRCYKFDLPESEMAADVPTFKTEIWCYQNLVTPAGATFIYNADGDEVRPELSMVVEPDGTITHGSLLKGEVSFHRIHSSEYNPFSIPLKEPVERGISFARPDLFRSARGVLNFMLNAPATQGALDIREGTFKAQATEMPFRGYWWPYRGQPLSGSKTSPLAKYDKFVLARTGVNPRAAPWENGNHRFRGVKWEGHCNGWAASSILRSEPSGPRTDPKTGITFSVSDQKGILAEKDYCVKVAFFGSRNRGSGNSRDIFPHIFHKTITYYIGTLNKPVALDYKSDASVDNHVMSGYTMTIKKTGARTYSVVSKVTMHKYDKTRENVPAVAPPYTITYRYRLTVDSAGNPISGTWLSGNPDFVWVPLSSTDCPNNNPRINGQWVDKIIYGRLED